MDLDLQIDGVPDHSVVDAIVKRVRRVRQLVTEPGEWRVTLSASENTRGQFDFGVRISAKQHFASFDQPINTLPEAIERQLRVFLQLPLPQPLPARRGAK
jgi:hypothetical protein